MKRFKLNLFRKSLLILFFLTNSYQIFAQDEWDDGPDPPPAAPIDDYIYPMMIVALVTVFYLFYVKEYKSEKSLKQN